MILHRWFSIQSNFDISLMAVTFYAVKYVLQGFDHFQKRLAYHNHSYSNMNTSCLSTHYGISSLTIFVQTRILCIVYIFTQKFCLFAFLSVGCFGLVQFLFVCSFLLQCLILFFNKLTMLHFENTVSCSVCAISCCVYLPCK